MEEETESIEQSIDRLLEVGVEGAKGYSRRNSNSFTLSRLKLMAEHLGIPKSLAKENLIKAIITKKQNKFYYSRSMKLRIQILALSWRMECRRLL